MTTNIVSKETGGSWKKRRKKPRIWRNWFGLRCWLGWCPCRMTMSHEPFGWRCVICREIQGYFLDDGTA